MGEFSKFRGGGSAEFGKFQTFFFFFLMTASLSNIKKYFEKMLKFKFPKIEEKHNFSEGEKCHLLTFEDCSLGTDHTRIMKIVSNVC